jgi:hypothetical protein
VASFAAPAVALLSATLLPLLLVCAATEVKAATAYVSDELVLGVYTEQNGQGQRIATLHSGAMVEALEVSGESTQVRLSDGSVGWVKSTYLITREPAAARLKELEEELQSNHATTPALAEAAGRSEMERLKRELAAKQSELDAARAAATSAPPGAAPAADRPVAESPAAAAPAVQPPGDDAPHAPAPSSMRRFVPLITAVVSLGVGFWMGYATLARRIRQRFGGIKVY